MRAALYVLAGILILVATLVQLGVLRGSRPGDLGVINGRLKPPASTPNSVSSQAALYPDHPQRAYADIAPLPLKNASGPASIQALAALLGTLPGTRVVEQRPDYLHAEAETRWLKFTDDIEFWFNPVRGVVELRGASRLGRRDFGMNRQRVEAIRSAYLARG